MDKLYRPPAHAPHIGKDELTGYNAETHKFDATPRDSAETAELKLKFNVANRRQAGVPINEPAVTSWNPFQSIADALAVSNTPGLIEGSAKKDFETFAKGGVHAH